MTVPAEGWALKLTLQNGRVIRPDILGEPTWIPSVNEKPEAIIQIKRTPGITNEQLDRAEAELFVDAQRVAIDRVDEVQFQSDGIAELTLSGGEELDNRVQTDVGNEAAYLVVEDLVTSETSYAADVDRPPESSDFEQTLQTASGTDDWTENVFDTVVNDAEYPVDVDGNGDLVQLQTAFVLTADQDLTPINGSSVTTDTNAEGETALNFLATTLDSASASINPEYRIPDGHATIAIRARRGPNAADLGPRLDVDVGNEDGLIVDSITTSYDFYTSTVTADISPGSQTVEVNLTNDDTGVQDYDNDGYVFDSVIIYDDRFHSSPLAAPSGSPPRFATPQLFADSLVAEAEAAVSPAGATDATVTITTNSTANSQAIGLKAEGESSFTDSSNTTSLSRSFADPVANVTARLTLSGHGTQSGDSPTQGINAQTVSEYDVTVGLSGIRRLISESYDGNLDETLREIAEETGALWELRYDGGFTLSWTQPGQRSSAEPLDASRWRVRRDATEQIEAVTVVGSRQRFEEPSPITPASPPSTVSLTQDRIVNGTESVSSTGGIEFESGADYELKGIAGELDILEAGRIDENTILEISYDYKIEGREEASDWDGDAATDFKFDLPGLTTVDGCRQAARRLIDDAGTPRVEAEVDLSTISPTRSVVESLDVEQIPDAFGPFRVRDFSRDPRNPTLRLGNGRDIDEEIARIRSQIGLLETKS